ncbi:MAG: serine hydrolase domain-containing protein [Thermoplasmatota archaeon]
MVISVVVLLSGCAAGVTVKVVQHPPWGEPWREATADEPGSLARLASGDLFDEMITRLMDRAHISALSAVIVQGDQVKWQQGYGLYDRAIEKEAAPDTIFLVASISKTVTATAVMQLQEQGLLNLDDDVNRYLPFSLRNPHHPQEPITLRMLLAHQSGLATDPSSLWGTGMPCIPGTLEVRGYPLPFLRDYLVPEGVQYRPEVWTTDAPGERGHYANFGFGVLGLVVERISGLYFEQYCREHIFAPLGMSDSSFFLQGVEINRTAIPYQYAGGVYAPLLHYDMLHYPAGGLRTTVVDLSHFLVAHMNGGMYAGKRLLSPGSVEAMHTEQYPGGDYGLGFQLWGSGEGAEVGHTGGLFGVTTKMVFRPADGLGLILFTNAGPYDLRGLLAFSLIEQLMWWKATGSPGELQMSSVENAALKNWHLMENGEVQEGDRLSLPEVLREVMDTRFGQQ